MMRRRGRRCGGRGRAPGPAACTAWREREHLPHPCLPGPDAGHTADLDYTDLHLMLPRSVTLDRHLTPGQAPTLQPSFPSPVVAADLFTVSMVWPFPECPRIGIAQYVAVSDWLLSFGDVHVVSVPCLFWARSSFLFGTEQRSVVWMDHRLFGVRHFNTCYLRNHETKCIIKWPESKCRKREFSVNKL